MPEPVLQARQINKSFGRVRALRGANSAVYPQEVVALVGDNGAGKSTLVKTMVGVHPPDDGEILFEGKPVTINTPHDARDLGIETVYQDLALAPGRSGGEHVPGPRGPAGGLLGRLGCWTRLDAGEVTRRFPPRRRPAGHGAHVATMSGGQRQGIAICRAVIWASRSCSWTSRPPRSASCRPASARAHQSVREQGCRSS